MVRCGGSARRVNELGRRCRTGRTTGRTTSRTTGRTTGRARARSCARACCKAGAAAVVRHCRSG